MQYKTVKTGLNRAEWEGPSILEIMLNQGQLGEGVEPKARQRLKRMCQWHLNGQKSEEFKKKKRFKKRQARGKKRVSPPWLTLFSGSSSRC